MANDRSWTGSTHGARISLGDEDELQKWTTSLGCTEVELRAVLQAIGSDAAKVRAYLQSKQAP